MSSVPYQIMSRNASIATPQEMEPMNAWADRYPIEEDVLGSTTFSTTYGDDWPANMQSNGQFTQTFIDQSQNIPTYMQPAGQFTGPFVDQSLNIPMHMPPAGQLTGPFVDPSLNVPTYTQPPGQFTQTFIDQSQNIPTYMQPAGQLTGPFVDQSPNIPMHMPPAGQLTGPFVNQSLNIPMHMPPVGQSTLTSLNQSHNTPTNIQGIGQATPAPARYGGNRNKKMQATGKSSQASAQGRKKHPAVVEDKDIERSAGEYNISYDEIRILKDYANARLKGIETSEPKDAPSRYIISRFEKVRRTYPEHATWPYDIPKEKIIRLLPGQKRQDRAPIKCYHDACEKRRQELDARYHESRQWEGPPPPPRNQTHQNTLAAPRIDDIPTGLAPPPSCNSNSAEAAEISTMMQHDRMDSFDKITPSAASYDVRMDVVEDGVQLPPPPPPTSTPTQPDSVNTRNYLGDGLSASDDIQMADSDEPAQFPLPPPTVTPREQENDHPLDNSNPPAVSVSDHSRYDNRFEEPLQMLDDSELDGYLDELAQRSSPLPTLTPPDHESPWPFHQDQPKEQRPFRLPNLDCWPTGAPIICHPLVRALEVHRGRKDPFRYGEFKGYTIPVSNYKARVPQFPAPADSEFKPEAEFMPQGYAMTEELKKEIEQRIRLHMKLRWGMDDDDGQKARSGELVREDLWRVAGEK